MENLEDHAEGRKELLKVPEQESTTGKQQNNDLPPPERQISWKRRQLTPGRRLGVNCNSPGKSNNTDLDRDYSMEKGKKETQMGAVFSPFSSFWPSNTTPTKHWDFCNFVSPLEAFKHQQSYVLYDSLCVHTNPSATCCLTSLSTEQDFHVPVLPLRSDAPLLLSQCF